MKSSIPTISSDIIDNNNKILSQKLRHKMTVNESNVTSLYDLPKDMLVHLISTIQEDNNKKYQELSDKYNELVSDHRQATYEIESIKSSPLSQNFRWCSKNNCGRCCDIYKCQNCNKSFCSLHIKVLDFEENIYICEKC